MRKDLCRLSESLPHTSEWGDIYTKQVPSGDEIEIRRMGRGDLGRGDRRLTR